MADLNNSRSPCQLGLPHGITLHQRCSFDDYIAWYLDREVRKGRRIRWPSDAAGRRDLMERRHAGKLLPWFSQWDWWQGQIQTPQALAGLMIPRSQQSIAAGLIDPLKPRTVGVAVDRLLAAQFFENSDPPGTRPHPFRCYYRQLLSGGLVLRGGNRLALRSLTPNESKEIRGNNGLYLLDGVGRSLPYYALLRQRRVKFRPIEVYGVLAPPCVYTWLAETLHHRTGEATPAGHGWYCKPSRHRAGHAVFGPYLSLPTLPFTVWFHLKTDSGRRRVAKVDVYDPKRRHVLASCLVHQGGKVALSFRNNTSNPLEFRVYWFGSAPLEVERIECSTQYYDGSGL